MNILNSSEIQEIINADNRVKDEVKKRTELTIKLFQTGTVIYWKRGNHTQEGVVLEVHSMGHIRVHNTRTQKKVFIELYDVDWVAMQRQWETHKGMTQ